ncbi:hypothetical protein BJ742DRAFT_800973 [Cladochytrium replicatum]|nr:hypothetical protein BJ742DRAFT_800973 [Cladochytrium replicatum]
MSATRTSASARPSSTDGGSSGGILVPGGNNGGASPSPSPIPSVLTGDTRGWVCDSNDSCGKGISATTIAALTVIGAIALLAIAGTVIWVRMRAKRDVNVGQAQKQRRDRYTKRTSRNRSRSRGQASLQRMMNKGQDHELKNVSLDDGPLEKGGHNGGGDPFAYMKQSQAPEQMTFAAPPPAQVNMKAQPGFVPGMMNQQPSQQGFQSMAPQPLMMAGGQPAPPYTIVGAPGPFMGQQQQFGPPNQGFAQGPPHQGFAQGPPPPGMAMQGGPMMMQQQQQQFHPHQ